MLLSVIINYIVGKYINYVTSSHVSFGDVGLCCDMLHYLDFVTLRYFVTLCYVKL